MSGSVWLPGLVVLGLGTLIGLIVAWRLRPSASTGQPDGLSPRKVEKRRRAAQVAEDLRLKIDDLEARRDDLYARLRGEREEADLDGRDRELLELDAARVLQDLDRVTTSLAELRPAGAYDAGAHDAGAHDATRAESTEQAKAQTPRMPSGEGSSPAPSRKAPGFLERHPLLVGFAFGGGLVGLVALLIFWAMQDAKPDPRAADAQMAQAEGQLPPDHPPLDGNGMDPDTAQRITDLEARVAANPEDLAGRKELSLLLLSFEQFLPAFEQATELLKRRPEDPDGLYVQGVVRLTMGQMDEAVSHMDRVLAQFPDHVLALTVRGVALMRLGKGGEAIETWERGLEAAGGSHPDIEFFLEQARAGGFEQLAAAVRERAEGERRGGTAALPADTSTLYVVDIELADGVTASPGAVLFVSLWPPAGGPPVAVKRLANPALPLTLTLGPQDLMMGSGVLPSTGRVVARLDADGSVETKTDGPAGEAEGRLGGRVRLALR